MMNTEQNREVWELEDADIFPNIEDKRELEEELENVFDRFTS